MTEFTKPQLEAIEDYYTARIEHDRPDPDIRLLENLRLVELELNKLEEE